METIPYGIILFAKMMIFIIIGLVCLDADNWLDINKKGPRAKQIYYECFPTVEFMLFMAICLNPALVKIQPLIKEAGGWETAVIFFDLFVVSLSTGAIMELPSITINEKHLR